MKAKCHQQTARVPLACLWDQILHVFLGGLFLTCYQHQGVIGLCKSFQGLPSGFINNRLTARMLLIFERNSDGRMLSHRGDETI